jgi:hypothetical protein
LPSRLGEIAVDRNTVSRIRVEDPLSLTTLLDELMMTLEHEVEDTESELQNDLYLPDSEEGSQTRSSSTLKNPSSGAHCGAIISCNNSARSRSKRP